MEGTGVGPALDALCAGADELLDAPLTAVPSEQLLGLVRGVELLRRRLDAVEVAVLAETKARREDDRAADVLVTGLQVAPGEARRRLRLAGELGPRATLHGEPLSPLLPATAAALRAGQLSMAHVAVISRFLTAVADLALPAELEQTLEHTLVIAARHENPRLLARTAAILLARLDQDGPPPREADTPDVTIFAADSPGALAPGRLRLSPELVAALEAVFDSLAAPQPTPGPGGTSIADPRSAGHRRHDALLELALRVLRSATLPAHAGAAATILITTSQNDLDHDQHLDNDQHGTATTSHGTAIFSHGTATTSHGAIWPVLQLRNLACDAEIRRVITGEHGEILHLGRTQRLASPAQRRALAARDHGCSFPGCTRPFAWAEVHHIREWRAGGTTDIDNLCLLCAYHHHNFTRLGWTVLTSLGVPEWIPPPWIDPERRPLRNTAHHTPAADLFRTLTPTTRAH